MNKYTHAIVREVSDNFFNGVTTSNLGIPDVKKTRKQHNEYCEALESNGIELIRLPKLNAFPDSVFVEDTAIKVDDIFVIGRAGVLSRIGECSDVTDVLGERFDLEFIKYPGTLEGGDVIKAGDHFFIGLSSRTNYDGIIQFINILDKKGFAYSVVPVRNVLHLKTGASIITDDCFFMQYVLTIEEFSRHFKTYNFFPHVVSSKENYAANVLDLNEPVVVIPKGFPEVRRELNVYLEPDIIEIDMSEFQKMDGSLTCLSILF